MFKFEVELPDYGYTHYFVVRNATADASQYSLNSYPLTSTFFLRQRQSYPVSA